MPIQSDSQGTTAPGAVRIELDSFLPADRRHALVSGVDLPNRMFGAAFFVDISGFTDLTDRLVHEHGPRRGAERLSEELGAMFELLVGVVHRHRGSVIGFAGDAITCWFAGNEGVLGAVAAAMESKAKANMPVKLVVTSGYANRFLVGDPDLQVLEVLAGAVVDRLAVAEQLARTGEVLVGGEILGWLGDRAQFEWRRDDLLLADRRIPEGESFAVIHQHSLPAPAPDANWPPSGVEPAMARRWIPPTVYSRIVRGEEAFVSELRMVATLFLRFGGIDYETDERAGQKLDSFVRRVQRTVHDLGGHVLEIVVGDKGSYLYATFGAVAGHEDDPLRAVRAALEIVTGSDLAAGVAVGISQGVALCGIYGGSERRTYGALGKPANEAARLMQAARVGSVLVSEPVGSAIRLSFTTDRRPDPVSGIDAYEVVGESPRGSRTSSALVGRTSELERMSLWVDEAQSGRGRVGVVVGEPGIGKTSLIGELTRRTETAGLVVALGRGSALDANTPYYAWREPFVDLLGFGDAATEEEIRSKLEPLFAKPDFDGLVPLLNPVLPIDLAPSERILGLSTQGRGDLTLDLMLYGLEALHPAVLIFDDGQWVDSASRHLLSLAVKNLPWLLVVIATRPTPELAPGADRIAGSAASDFIEMAGIDDVLSLGSLPDDQIIEVVANRLGIHSVPDELGSLLTLRSGGNPFFAEELALSLAQEGLIAITDRKAVVRGSLQALRQTLPETVITRVQARLSALPQQLQTTVMVASLLGQEFDLALLADVHPTVNEADQIRGQLEELIEAGVMASDEGAEGVYRFNHTLIREAAVGLPVTETARRIHHRAAAWIEQRHSDLSGSYSILAYHWGEAGVTAKAIMYEAAAAERALVSGAYDEAVNGFRAALDLYESDHELAGNVEAARWHMLLGEARVFQQGEDERQAREDLIRGLELIGEAPPRILPHPLATIGRLAEQVRNRWIGRSPTNDPQQVERFRLAARAYEQLVEVYFLANDDLASLHASFRTLNLAEKAGAPAELARGFATVGALVGLIPRPKLADRYLDRAEAAAEATDDLRAVMWVALVRGFYYAGVGRWDVAETSSARGRDLAAQLGDRRRLEDGLAALMVEKWFQGRLVEAEGFANEIQRLAQRRRARRSQAYAAQGRAYVYVEMGETAKAEAAIEELERLGYNIADDDRTGVRRPDDEALANDTLALRSLTHLRAQRVDQAVVDARLLIHRMRGVRPFNFSAFMAYNAAAEVLVMATVQEPTMSIADDDLERAIKLSEAYAKIFPIGRARPLLWRGMVQTQRGKTNMAIAGIEEAAEVARSLALSLDEARALYELGHLGVGGADRAREITSAAEAHGVAANHGRDSSGS